MDKTRNTSALVTGWWKGQLSGCLFKSVNSWLRSAISTTPESEEADGSGKGLVLLRAPFQLASSMQMKHKKKKKQTK